MSKEEKAREKRNVLSLSLKSATESLLRTVCGSEFQTDGAQHRKVGFANGVAVVLRPTRHNTGHFGYVSPSQSLGLLWKKTKPNTTKARKALALADKYLWTDSAYSGPPGRANSSGSYHLHPPSPLLLLLSP